MLIFLESICATNLSMIFLPDQWPRLLTPLLTCSPLPFFSLLCLWTIILRPTSSLPYCFLQWIILCPIPSTLFSLIGEIIPSPTFNSLEIFYDQFISGLCRKYTSILQKYSMAVRFLVSAANLLQFFGNILRQFRFSSQPPIYFNSSEIF